VRVGLFLSRDDGRISETVDVDLLAREYAHLPVARVYDNFFRYEDQQDLLKTIDENGLEAIVFAGNSPKYFENVSSGTVILEALESRGINQNKIAFANIKEQVALPHAGENGKATKKAKLLIETALAKVEICHGIKMITVSPRRSVLVVGTTAGGIIAAQALLEKGYKVYLAEKDASIGKGTDAADDFLATLSAVQSNDKARFFFEAEISDVSGWCGEYRIMLNTQEGKKEIVVGGIILSVGDNTEWIRELTPKMQLDVDRQGLIREKHKLGHIGQTRDPGIWFVPFRKGKKRFAADTLGAGMAVLSLSTILDKNEIDHPVFVSEVDETVCGGCGTCVKTCAFSASSIDPVRNISVIDPKRCKGCGNCVVACPTGARDLVNFPEKYLIKAIDILSRGVSEDGEPKVLAILCNGCGYPAADAAGELSYKIHGLQYPLNVMPVRVECGGNVDTQYVLRAFRKGFDGVVISVCRDGHCHHIVGNTDMDRRMGLFREVLRSRNLDDERLRIIHVSPHEGKLFAEELNSFCYGLRNADIGENG
jgi:heterodisulfide reductase subunit A-like polyferredoxin/coenzyme F420-reducing hydrogenase delta subunit